MNKINLKIRAKKIDFWISLVSSIIILFNLLGFDLAVIFSDFPHIYNFVTDYENVINSIFGILAILGVVTDPTTKGFGDSDRALTYTKLGE